MNKLPKHPANFLRQCLEDLHTCRIDPLYKVNIYNLKYYESVPSKFYFDANQPYLHLKPAYINVNWQGAVMAQSLDGKKDYRLLILDELLMGRFDNFMSGFGICKHDIINPPIRLHDMYNDDHELFVTTLYKLAKDMNYYEI